MLEAHGFLIVFVDVESTLLRKIKYSRLSSKQPVKILNHLEQSLVVQSYIELK
jgi:hypothetical protein